MAMEPPLIEAGQSSEEMRGGLATTSAKIFCFIKEVWFSATEIDLTGMENIAL